MDAAKLRNSCICGNSEPYASCCGRFAEKPESGFGVKAILGELRYALHELHMHLFPLRMLYQQYWEKLSQEAYPHHVLMEDGDYGRAIVEHFFWDYSVQFSDARPIMRAARELDGRDLRLGHDLLQWSFAPLWPYFVVECDENEAYLRQVGHAKMHRVLHDGRMPPPGHGVWIRLLSFRGKECVGMTRLATPQPIDPGHFDALLQASCQELGQKPKVSLRPDVHCDEWRRHGSLFLAQWRQLAYDSVVGRPSRTLSASPGLEIPTPNDIAWQADLSRHPKVRKLGEGRFEVRHRGLALARLESKGQRLILSLFDPVFAPAVHEILDGLGLRFDDLNREQAEPHDLGSHSSATWDAWMHIPHAALGGQTPIQASTHDFGRLRLRKLLHEMAKRGRDITEIMKQLRL
jgi:Protein of unknown function (DUF2384)